MAPFNNFTTKAKEAIRKAHELAIERGQNHVNPLHLLTALVLQEESTVYSILEKLDADTIFLTDSLMDLLETPETAPVMSQSYQLYLTPELAQVLEGATKLAQQMGDQFVSTEHLFIAIFDYPGPAQEILVQFQFDRQTVLDIVEELRENNISDIKQPKGNRSIQKYTRSLTELARDNKLDPVIGREMEIGRAIQILSRRTKNNRGQWK